MSEDSLQKKYNELSKTLQAYQAAVNVAAIVSITDPSGRIIYVNDKFTEISKYSSAELAGKTHRVINSGYHSPEFFKEMWRMICHGKPWRGEIKNKTKNGSYYWVDTVITPVLDEKNNIFQFLSIQNLITLQKENEEQLIAFQRELLLREQQLKAAQQVARTGSWYMNIPANTLEWSEETYRIFEIPPETVMTDELFVEKVFPDDRPKVHECWLEGTKKGVYEVEHRIATPSGEKWVREKARLEFDSSGEPVRAVGTVQDITEKKKTENILRESESLYKNLFNNSPFPNGIVDKKTLQFLEVNETATRLYGYSREEFLQLSAYDIRVPEDRDKLKGQLEEGSYAGDTSVRPHKKKNGEVIQAEPSIAEISYKGKQAFLVTINDVTEKIRLQEQLIRSRISRQNEISRASMEAQEKNRAEIGRELHDNVNQLLAVSHLCIKNIQPASAEDKKLIEKGIQATSSAINEIRKLSWSLVPPSLSDLSLKDSVETLAMDLNLTGAVVEFDIRINETLISEGLKVNMFRIIQEQFSNIIKYAEAANIKIIMTQQDDRLTLEISDNGKGFDRNQKFKGIGLNNIIHRAETYNGEVTIESSPGHGCKIFIQFIL
jgi:PAS domain S-box-containing protein